MSATAAGSMASYLTFGDWPDLDDIDSDEILQPVIVKLRPGSPASFPPGLLEPQMTQELLKGMLSNDFCRRVFARHNFRTNQRLNR